MNVVEETRVLRRGLAALAAEPEWELLNRYDLYANKPQQSVPDRIVRLAKRLLKATRLIARRPTMYPWQATLKHSPVAEDAGVLLIWALGVERDVLRQACEGFAKRLEAESLAPVLVTDVADFAYYSRLGWLVEYLPELSGEGQSYFERKQRYLAWRYRDAVVVPMSAGLADELEWKEVLGMSTA